jgi:16S rRNA processing protein RimM
MEILTDYPELIAQRDYLYLGPTHKRYKLESVRAHKNLLLLKLRGCDDRNAAETLREALVEVAIDDAVPLEDDEYYHFQITGMQAETEEGQILGEIVEVLGLPQGANDVYVIHGPFGEILVPAIDEVVVDLDVEAGRMILQLPPGLVELS